MDIVYPLKNETDNDYMELKYSLRSLTNLSYDKVIIVGGKPSWITGVIHVDAEDTHSLKGFNSMKKILAAFDVVSENFIYMNDDFFLLKPQEIAYFHQNKLKDNVDRKGPLLNYSRYWAGMKRVTDLFNSPLDYEVHYPYIFDKNKLLELTNKYNMEKQYALRSLYGNEYKVGGEYLKDNKVYDLETFKAAFKNESFFVSSSDQLPVDEAFIEVLDTYFPNKSPYEK